MKHKLFGQKLRKLREANRYGIKDLAAELGIAYTQLSNIELGYKKPSEDLIKHVAKLFREDEEKLKILAGYIPEDISEIILNHPKDAPEFLRSKFKGPKHKK